MNEAHARRAATADRPLANLRRRIEAVVRRARLALLWERLWPRLAWPFGVALLFIAVSWAGLWTTVPEIARLVLLGAFGAAFLGSFFAFRGLSAPSRAEALHRVESVSGYDHRPLLAVEDSLAGEPGPDTAALWQAHRERMARAVRRLAAGIPHPDLPRADRFGLRVALALLLFAGFFAAGEERFARIFAAFRVPAVAAPPEIRVDAWLTPPAYTGRAPILLTGEGRAGAEGEVVRAPEGSLLIVQSVAEDLTVELVEGDKKLLLEPKGEAARAARPDMPGGPRPIAARSGPIERSQKLAADSVVTVSRGGQTIFARRIVIEPDADPTIRFAAPPEVQLTGALKFSYEVSDDYGVVSAEARLNPAASAFPTASRQALRPLIGAPDFALSLPPGKSRTGAAQTIRDLTAHPWAGAKVTIRLLARDEAGQEGWSEALELTLPQRAFRKPLARALVEQRRLLALDANRAGIVGDALEALFIAPDRIFEDVGAYLGVDQARRMIRKASSDADLVAVVDLLWTIALQIEDGDLSLAEQELRQAQEELRQALERGAPEEEIKRLTEQLRQALDKYLRQLAEQALRNPQQRAQPSPRDRALRQQDLEKMLQRIEELARTGARDAARELLSQLQQMLENLRTARPQQMPNEMDRQMSELLDKLGEMIQRQQELMDQTHRLDRPGERRSPRGDRRQQTPDGMTREQLEEALRQLQEGQAGLQRQLQELMEKLGKDGRGEAGELGRAGREMGEARDALGRGETGEALGSQGRALEALRDGARQLLEQMMGDGQDGPARGMAEGEEPDDTDPLGRPRRNSGPDPGRTVKVPDEIDTQRARRILEDIRRRLSEPYRPRIELDYLERLLRPE